MSDSITVRVTLDAYDMASTGRQTQVYAQIPEVARVSWLLPSDMFHRLKDRAWPEVLDVTHDYVTYGGAASNSSTTAAWKAVMEWLRDDANRDEVQAAWEEHEARQHPVARKLLARVAELEAERHTTNEALSDAAEALRRQRDRITELGERLAEYERPADEDPIRYALTEQADGEVFVPRTEREHWVAIADALNAAHAAGMPVGIDLDGTLTDHRMWSVVWDRKAERWTVAGYEDGDVR